MKVGDEYSVDRLEHNTGRRCDALEMCHPFAEYGLVQDMRSARPEPASEKRDLQTGSVLL